MELASTHLEQVSTTYRESIPDFIPLGVRVGNGRPLGHVKVRQPVREAIDNSQTPITP